jgi:hypothetical protein
MSKTTRVDVPDDWTPNLPTFVLTDHDVGQRLSDVFVEARYILGDEKATEVVNTVFESMVAGWAEESDIDHRRATPEVNAFTSEDIATRVGSVESEIHRIAGEDTALIIDIIYTHLTGDWSAE